MKSDKNIEIIEAISSLHMEILEVGHAHLDTAWNYKDVTYSFSQVYFPLCGSAQFSFCGQTIDLLPGKIYLVPAGLSYSCACSGSMEKLLIDFTMTGPDGTDIFYGIGTCLEFPDHNNFTQRLKELYSSSHLTAAVKLKLLILEIVETALTIAPTKTVIPKYSPLTKQALSYIDSHLSSALTIGEIAEHLFVSALTLQKHFREEIGKPIGKYIAERIMVQAERLLLNSPRSIREISNRLGFCDQFYFSRVFSQHYGLSPSQFRKLHSK